MTDLIYDFITQGIDLLIVGVVLIAMVTLLVAANKLTNVISTQDSMNDRIAKVKEFNQYDGQKVLPQEVGSAIMKYCTNEGGYTICVLNGDAGSNKAIFTANDVQYDSTKNATIVIDEKEFSNGTAMNVVSSDYVSKALEDAGVNQQKKYMAILLTSKGVETDDDGNYKISFTSTSASAGNVILGIAFIESTTADGMYPEVPVESSEVESSEIVESNEVPIGSEVPVVE